MTRIARAYNSHNSFAFDDLTGFTPAFDGRSDFHLQIQPSNCFLGGRFYVLLRVHPHYPSAVLECRSRRDACSGWLTNSVNIHLFFSFSNKNSENLKKIKKNFFSNALFPIWGEIRFEPILQLIKVRFVQRIKFDFKLFILPVIRA